jgi:hypothetical protein
VIEEIPPVDSPHRYVRDAAASGTVDRLRDGADTLVEPVIGARCGAPSSGPFWKARGKGFAVTPQPVRHLTYFQRRFGASPLLSEPP